MTKARKSRPEPGRRQGRPPGANRDATTARILAAAQDCFALQGYAGTTNKDIAQRAGVTAAAIYQYFDSKAALYMATVAAAQAQLVPAFRAAVADQPTTRGALRALVIASGQLDAQDRSITGFLSALPVEMHREAEIASAMAETPSEVVSIVIEVVERGVRAGEVAREKADAVVSMFLACLMGLSLYAAAIDDGQFPSTIDAFVALIDGTLIEARPRAARRGKPRRVA
jgi:AcrR family transcriptional regulator